jgi:hypothetical protein
MGIVVFRLSLHRLLPATTHGIVHLSRNNKKEIEFMAAFIGNIGAYSACKKKFFEVFP